MPKFPVFSSINTIQLNKIAKQKPSLKLAEKQTRKAIKFFRAFADSR